LQTLDFEKKKPACSSKRVSVTDYTLKIWSRCYGEVYSENARPQTWKAVVRLSDVCSCFWSVGKEDQRPLGLLWFVEN